jgi:hypothetical protein
VRSVKVDYSDYRRSHGKMPRGRGHWFFFFNHAGTFGNCFSFNGSFTNAKKAAKKEAKARQVSTVYVGS